MSLELSVRRPRTVAEQESTRFIYVFTAVLFIVVAVAGFAPRSLAIVMGARPCTVHSAARRSSSHRRCSSRWQRS
jgi:hypothetical protein